MKEYSCQKEKKYDSNNEIKFRNLELERKIMPTTYYWNNVPRSKQVGGLSEESGCVKLSIPRGCNLYQKYKNGVADRDTAPYFFQKFNYHDFRVKVRITTKLKYRHDQVGILIKANQRTYIMCGLHRFFTNDGASYGSLIDYVSVITHHKPSLRDVSQSFALGDTKTPFSNNDPQNVTINQKNPKERQIYVQIIKRDKHVECYYSIDDQNYTLIRVAQFGSKNIDCHNRKMEDNEEKEGKEKILSVGVYGASPNMGSLDGFLGKKAFSVKFDNFSVEELKEDIIN